ncbi:MAG: DUF1501 domain-containing protein [Rhodoferax sp.]|nr:DUF1501 domain-containing protein [Rhodoferax sp.]
MTNSSLSRRAFLNHSAAWGGMTAVAPWAMNLALTANAAAQVSNSDYKALVLVFLLGGNDHYNTIVPFDLDSYNAYAKVRTDPGAIDDGLNTIALARSTLTSHQLNPLNPWPSGRSFAMNPALAKLKSLFDTEKLALLMNVGSLSGPLTKANYLKGIDVPAKLFSHNDQTLTWVKGEINSKTGFGGRLADFISSQNEPNTVLSGINLNGGAFLGSSQGPGYRLGSSGAVPLTKFFNNDMVAATVKKLMLQSGSHYMHSAYVDLTAQAFNAVDVVNPPFLKSSVAGFPATPLGDQLKTIARMISCRNTLGVKRQVFYATLGGFDTHAGMPDNHNALLAQVADAMSAFYEATDDLGVADQVTTFTGSDFGRTLSSNGDGSDHGWGSFHMVMGGAVKGKRWYGGVPTIAVDGPDDVGSGRLLPSVSVDQYMSTLALWFGAPSSILDTIIPRIKRYNTSDLGFMR